MIAWLATFPPAVPALIVVGIYVYLAAGRWAWPMTLDAALLGLYVWRPSLALFAFVVALLLVRWLRPLAQEVAWMFRLLEYGGWTAKAVLFCLPALACDMLSYDNPKPRLGGTQVVHVPVSSTGTEANGDEVGIADQDADDAGFDLPRISRHNTDEELVIYLAAQRRSDGKFKFSGNDIYDLMKSKKGKKGMERPDVQAIVRAIQNPAPEFPPMTEDQQRAREDLGLEPPPR